MGMTVAGLAALAGCAMGFSDFETDTRIGRAMGQSQAETLDARLRDAAFTMVAGQTIDEVRTTLVADGATCGDAPPLVCEWTVDRREGAFDVAAGIRPPGPARTWRIEYAVQFDATPVTTPADIVARVQSERID